MESAIFIVLTFIAISLAFVAYVVALNVVQRSEERTEEIELIRRYLKGLYYGLWVSSWVLAIIFPILGVFLIIHFALAFFG